MTGLLQIASMSFAAEPGSSGDREALLRQSLEEQFRESTGLGFVSFDCDMPDEASQVREVTCLASDEEGDQFIYRIVFPETAEAPSVTTAQPVSQLNASGRAVIERPCLAFLAAYANADWGSAHEELSPELQTELSVQGLHASLEPLREATGAVRSVDAKYYTTPSPGLHVLEYAMGTEGGNAVARFRIRFDENEQPRIVAFLISSEPGSELQATLLSETGQEVLSGLFGVSVVRMEAPLEQLGRAGDAVEGTVWLDTGEDYAIRVYQHSTAHDLDGNDYSFQVLDVPWLIQRYLKSSGMDFSGVICPSRVAPDGDRLDCVVEYSDGTESAMSVERQGGDYRLIK